MKKTSSWNVIAWVVLAVVWVIVVAIIALGRPGSVPDPTVTPVYEDPQVVPPVTPCAPDCGKN